MSDASTVKNLQRDIILSESEEQVSHVEDISKHEATLTEKREDQVDYSYNDDGVWVLPVEETIREVREGFSETVNIRVLDTQDQG